MSNILNYKGYSARVEFSAVDNVLFGKIEGITDLVTFESSDASQIESEFRNAVDDYLDFCAEVGKEPSKSYKGVFNVRISPELHKGLAMKAFANNTTINHEVEEAVRVYVSGPSMSDIVERAVTKAIDWSKAALDFSTASISPSPTGSAVSYAYSSNYQKKWRYAQ